MCFCAPANEARLSCLGKTRPALVSPLLHKRVPARKSLADRRFLAIQTLLKSNPRAGHESEIVPGAREFPVPQTPFGFVYQLKDDHIEVLLVVDNRSDWRGGQI
jgi:plasmid stabilization system protein ParE